jgi:two-component system CheB/CheR fusion protein
MKSSNLSVLGKLHPTVFTVVAIGAAEGGLDAMTQLLETLAPDTGMSFVYILRKDNEYNGVPASDIAKFTHMKVVEAAHEMVMEPDVFYVVPPDADMSVSNGMFIRSGRKAKAFIQAPIDGFFKSLAEQNKDGSIGIILSGTGSDGAAGLKAIKIAGGITFAQDETAKYDEMPKAAMSEGAVDLVLPPVEIARELENLSKQSGMFTDTEVGLNSVSDSDEDLLNIIQLLKKSTGIDFSHYKVSTVKRRVVRRMLLYKLGSLREYFDYLKRHNGEITVLYHDLLINVTCFFRDGDSMEYLKKTILPQVIRSKSADETVRIWVPACSTGEEAYSLAILLVEIQEDRGSRVPIQLFGTDLSEIAISKARQGIFSASDLADMHEIRLERYFVKMENNNYRIHKSIRDLCVFAQHNVFKDPPFSRLDLISCCNFFIYLDSVLQQRCTSLFNYALNPQGYLVLGKSETIGTSTRQLFSQVEKKFKVYVKNQESSERMAVDRNIRMPFTENRENGDQKKPFPDFSPEIITLERSVDDILYAKYIPAAVVINQEMEILQFRGSTSLFLEPSRGKASFNLMKMVHPALMFDLRNCIHKASSTKTAARKDGVELPVKDQTHLVSLEVVPVQSNNDDKVFIIIFEEQHYARPDRYSDFSKDEMVQRLQEELTAVRNDMRSIIEEQEASKEELQSANEEIISSNEELQSINEELESSKEEVESANEELMATNDELQISNEQLSELQEYAEAIFETIREGVVVLNKDFRVKMANTSFYRTFHTRAEEMEGLPIYEVANGQWNTPKMREMLNNILHEGRHFEGYEVLCQLPGLGSRTMLVNGRRVIQKANRQELMLLAFEDITDRKLAEKLNAEREEWFRSMANNAPTMIWTAAPDGSRTFFNVTWLTFTGRTMEQDSGYGWIEVVFPEDKETFLAEYRQAFEEQRSFEIEYRLRRADGEYRWVRAIGKPTFTESGGFSGMVGICAEIHNSKLMQEELERIVEQRTADLRELNKELQKSNGELQQFAYVASHDLQEPLRKILTFSDRLTSDNAVPVSARSFVDKISASAARMSQLIRDVLDFSSATKVKELFTQTDLNAVLKTILSDFDLLIKEKNAVVVADDLPVIEAIPLQMEQLFHNMVSNALKFSRAQVAPVIKITCRELAPASRDVMEGLRKDLDYVEIIFEDNGIGFNNEFAERIFIIFQRLNGRREYAGTGIGLALCRRISDNHCGMIYASSIEHVRTEFHVILPVRQQPSLQ